jgi:hypothetical protein
MESPELAQRRRRWVDALMMCLTRSKLPARIDLRALRAKLDGVELWQKGKLDLDLVWKLLIGSSFDLEEAAPALLAMKSFEGELGAPVRLPMALEALSQKEEARLREQVAVTADEIARVMQAPLAPEPAAPAAPAAPQPEAPSKKVAAPRPAATRPGVSLVAALPVVLGGVAIAGAVAWLQLRDTATAMNMNLSEAIVHLEQGKRDGAAMTAKLADPKWDGLNKDERRALADKLLDAWVASGVQQLVVTDASGAVKINASTLGGVRVVAVY